MRWLFVLVSVVVLWNLQGCDDENPNPCEGATPVTANFFIGEQLAGSTATGGLYFADSLFITDDTLKTNDFVHSVAEEKPGYSYEWKIGFDNQIYTDAHVSLKFLEVQNNLPIRLIVRAEPNQSCFSTDDGIDTAYRYLTIVPLEAPSPMVGKYKGHTLENPDNEFIVEIKMVAPIEGFAPIQTQLFNINPGCTAIDDKIINRTLKIVSGYRNLLIMPNVPYITDQNCFVPRGWATLDQTWKTLTIDYSIQVNEDSEERNDFRFIGKRIE